MDGVHDLGGRQGFGPVVHSTDAAVFHEEWEKRINALYGVAVRAGLFNMDEYRHAIERMEPRHYMMASYYERTFTAVASLCVERGVCSAGELSAAAGFEVPLSRPSREGRVADAQLPEIRVGDRVRVKDNCSSPMPYLRLRCSALSSPCGPMCGFSSKG